MGVALKAQPDWIGAAQALVAALEAQPDADGRVQVVEATREALGDQVYPAFIKLLCAVGRFADPDAKRLVAEALAHGLATARPPATRLPAWGASGGFASLGLGGGLPLTNLRAAGPVEFLCIWLHRELSAEALSEEGFLTAMPLLLEVLDAAPAAASLYRARLKADLESPTEGLHTAASRRSTQALVDAWADGAGPAEAARRALAAARADREASRWDLAGRAGHERPPLT